MIAVDPSAQETGSGDSVASSPQHGLHLKSVRFMCYFGGEIRVGPNDNKLRYVGGDTHIITLALHTKPLRLTGVAESDISVKYQLPNGELISVTSDEDVENMMAEYDRILGSALQDDVQDLTSSAAGTIRLFLFNKRGIVSFFRHWINKILSCFKILFTQTDDSGVIGGITSSLRCFLNAVCKFISGLKKLLSELERVVSVLDSFISILQRVSPKLETKLTVIRSYLSQLRSFLSNVTIPDMMI
ncbi:hypothetical protein CUMW_037780 [Citrus unshiu]|nr:hypothetical protein CUMW_037780 [Citrus unshiu]